MERSKRTGVVRNRFEDLEPEIISDILSRLPIVLILRCKCVCKTWHALIKDDYFAKVQLHRTNDLPSSHVILESYPDAAQFKSGKINRFLVDIQDHSSTKARVIPTLEDTLNDKDLKIMCSLNGWICLAPEGRYADPVVVCNPIISGDFITLPKSEHDHARLYDSHQLTLGFDHLINKYKAVRMSIYYDDVVGPVYLGCFIEVITVGEETSWRRVFHRDNELHIRVPRGGVFHQGSIYWILDRSNPDGDYVLEFDVSKEVFRVINFPVNLRRPDFRPSFRQKPEGLMQIMEGTVTLLQSDDCDAQLVHIWQIVRGGNSNDQVVEYSSTRISLSSKIPRARIIALLHSDSGFCDFWLLQRAFAPWMKPDTRVNHKRSETEFLYYFPYSYSSKKIDMFTTSSGLQVQSDENFIAWCFKPSLVSVKKALLGN